MGWRKKAKNSGEYTGSTSAFSATRHFREARISSTFPGQCCRVAIICGLSSKFPKKYHYISSLPSSHPSYPRAERRTRFVVHGVTIADNVGQGTIQIHRQCQCGVESGIIPKH